MGLLFSEIFGSRDISHEWITTKYVAIKIYRSPSTIQSKKKPRRAQLPTPEYLPAFPLSPPVLDMPPLRNWRHSHRYKPSAYIPFPQRSKKLSTRADGTDYKASRPDLPPKQSIFGFEAEAHDEHVWPVAGGATFDVYRGELQNGTAVAVKCLRLPTSAMSEETITQMAREIHAWADFKHPNVIEVLGVTRFQHRLALVAPWMENGNLVDYVKRNDADRWDMCSQVADGLAYLHGHQMIHGDVKGANVLVSDYGMPRLVDFGNSLLNYGKLQFTTAGSNTFSARWMAPEMLNRQEGSLPCSMLADVYALGMMILEVMTGEEPYREYKKDFQVTAAVIKGIKPVRPPELGPETTLGDNRWLTITHCWNQLPSSRPKASQVKDMMIVLGRV